MGTPALSSDTRRRAFTLLEVILAVALSVFVVASIAAAVRLNLVVLENQRQRIERAQIARNVLMMIKKDLRAAIQYKPADVTGLDELSASQAAIAGFAAGIDTSTIDPELVEQATGAAAGANSSETGGAAADADEDGSQQTSMANQNIAAGVSEPVRPGLYGNQSEIMIDISRLPRIDQYNPVVAAGQTFAALPSDIKTVAFFVSQESLDSQLINLGVETASPGGLYRREIDRAVGVYAYGVGSSIGAAAETKLIASEVAQIEFRYFDGENWQSEWDSDEQNGFPMAIELVILVDSRRAEDRATNAALANELMDNQHTKIYRSVVNLPIAEILPEEIPAAPSSSSQSQGSGSAGNGSSASGESSADPGGDR